MERGEREMSDRINPGDGLKPRPCRKCGEAVVSENIDGSVWITYCDNHRCSNYDEAIELGKAESILKWNKLQSE